jgi:hypothetical protein
MAHDKPRCFLFRSYPLKNDIQGERRPLSCRSRARATRPHARLDALGGPFTFFRKSQVINAEAAITTGTDATAQTIVSQK